jgi:riboflavin synthase
MFTGLIEATGRLVERRPIDAGFRLRIDTPIATELKEGDSVAVNGVCLTVVLAAGGEIHADVGPETARITTLGTIVADAMVNLERPLRADGRFGGHFVQGHVDAIGRIEARRPEATFEWLTVAFPSGLAPFIVLKGSIAVDGISLTVAALGRDRFDVQIVPFTLEHTNLRTLGAGDRVNLECDLVGKYVVRAAELAQFSTSDVPR